MVYQFAVDISESPCNAYLLSNIISQERKLRVSKYVFEEDKNRSIVAEVLLRYGLEKEYGLKNGEIKFGFGDYRKPYLINAADIFFNLSHSDKWVYCGIGDTELGVDVEKTEDNHIEIARRFFADSEYRYILQQSPETRKDIFYKLWTLKESYVKTVGKGLYINLDSFCFEMDDTNVKLLIDGREQSAYQFFSCKLDTEHWTSLCVHDFEKVNLSENIVKIPVQQLIEFYL